MIKVAIPGESAINSRTTITRINSSEEQGDTQLPNKHKGSKKCAECGESLKSWQGAPAPDLDTAETRNAVRCSPCSLRYNSLSKATAG
jgi:DNA-directed RNA polymerase subunit RPC12/RpoP